jgi:hypothetical protein
LASLSGFYAYVVARGDTPVTANPVRLRCPGPGVIRKLRWETDGTVAATTDRTVTQWRVIPGVVVERVEHRVLLTAPREQTNEGRIGSGGRWPQLLDSGRIVV